MRQLAHLQQTTQQNESEVPIGTSSSRTGYESEIAVDRPERGRHDADIEKPVPMLCVYRNLGDDQSPNQYHEAHSLEFAGSVTTAARLVLASIELEGMDFGIPKGKLMLTATKLIAQQNARPPVASVPNAHSELMKDLPSEGQFGPDDEPFLYFASMGTGRLIPVEEWDRLDPDEQRFVLASLSAREISLYRRESKMVTVHEWFVGRAVEVNLDRQFRYEFSVSDHRITGEDNVAFVVENVHNPVEARRVLRKFLKQLQQLGTTVH